MDLLGVPVPLPAEPEDGAMVEALSRRGLRENSYQEQRARETFSFREFYSSSSSISSLPRDMKII